MAAQLSCARLDDSRFKGGTSIQTTPASFCTGTYYPLAFARDGISLHAVLFRHRRRAWRREQVRPDWRRAVDARRPRHRPRLHANVLGVAVDEVCTRRPAIAPAVREHPLNLGGEHLSLVVAIQRHGNLARVEAGRKLIGVGAAHPAHHQ